MNVSPKTRRNISRILPFGIIWLFCGIVFLLVESAATRATNLSPASTITLSPRVLVFALIAVFIVGLCVGSTEVLLFDNLFSKRSFTRKLLYKTGLYLLFMLMIATITFPVAASLEARIPVTDPEVWRRFKAFIFSVTFASTILQMSASLVLCLFYAGISDNLGHNVLVNMLTGRYHLPREEKRVFMFLDMRSSTTIAEKLGHTRYYKLLRDYYNDFSDPIVNRLGEVYQYIGDEIVVSWPYKSALRKSACLHCFFDMKKAIHEREAYYMNTYGLVPDFKAGMHLGEVTTGEIGALKREIVFTGDVLNSAARIQGLCNQFETDLLISGALLDALPDSQIFTPVPYGTVELSGKAEMVELFGIEPVTPSK